MPSFHYQALDATGRQTKGLMEGDGVQHVRQKLRSQGLVPLEIRDSVKKAASANSSLTASFGSPKMSAAELALFTRQLATLLESGMPLAESFQILARQERKARIVGIITEVRSSVIAGHGLADSMKEFPKAFPELYRATIAAGEHAGRLDQVLDKLAEHTEKSYESKQKVQLAMIYPAVLIFVSLAVVTGLMIFVVPGVVEVFSDQGEALPVLTRIMISISSFITHYGFHLLAGIVLAVILLRFLTSKPPIKRRLHRSYLSIPIVQSISRSINTTRFTGTLSTLHSSGVPLIDAMAISGEVMPNLWLRHLMKDVSRKVKEGSNLNMALEQTGQFPPMMVAMVASGEMSGSLDQMLERAANNQQKQLEGRLEAALGIMEPLILVFMGASVLLIVLAILQPIFELNNLI